MSFRDFDAAEAERSGDPVTFQLGGRKWTAAHVNAANFLTFTRQMAEGGTGVLIGFDNFARAVLPEREREAFATMLAAKDIKLGTLLEVVNWLVEQASGNPLAAGSPSPATPSNTGEPPKVLPLAGGSTTSAPSASAVS